MDYQKIYEELVKWLKDWFEDKGDESKLIVGVSGGMDSTLTIDIAVKALGRDRVLGILMPNGNQHDIEDSFEVIRSYEIPHIIINIEEAVKAEVSMIKSSLNKRNLNKNTIGNIEARIRMTTLYAVGSEEGFKGFVSNNCNLSEDYVGYSTKYGDAAGDVGLLRGLLKTDIYKIAKCSNKIPKSIMTKKPIDGLTTNHEGGVEYRSDEESMGFTYVDLDNYIKGNYEGLEEKTVNKIKYLHKISQHKREMIPHPSVY